MYENAQSKVRVGSKYSIEFNGVHQGSVISPLFVCNCHGGYIYIEYRIGCPWELLYTDDLVTEADSLDSSKICFQC